MPFLLSPLPLMEWSSIELPITACETQFRGLELEGQE